LDVVLKDLPWHPNLSLNQSTEYNNLVKEFNDKMTNLNNSLDGNILKAEVSNFRRLDAGNVTARMFFRFLRGYWQTLLQLQETFENGTLFNSTIEVLSCSANDDGK